MKGARGQVMVGTPSISGELWFDYHNSYVHSLVAAANNGWSVQTNGMSQNSLIPYARAIIGQDFVESECDVLFFVDSDLSWDPQAFVRILNTPLDVVGGAYPVKQEGVEHKFHIKLLNGSMPEKKGNLQLLVRTTKVAGGFVKITRKAMEEMQAAYPELKAHYRGRDIHMLWDPMIVNGEPLGEDFSFCQRWTDIGGEIYVDPDIDFGHYGRKVYRGNFLRDVIQQEN